MEEIDKTVDVEIVNDDNQREKLNELNKYIDDIQHELPMIQEVVEENDYINLLKDSITQIPQVIGEVKELNNKMLKAFDSIEETQKVQNDFIKRQDEANKNIQLYIQNLEQKTISKELVSETVSTIIQEEFSKNNNNDELLKEIKSSKTMNVIAITMSSITLISVVGALAYFFLTK